MSIFDDAFNELFTRVQAVWTDVATNGLTGTTASYMNWRELVSLNEDVPGSGLAAPWLVVDMGAAAPVDQYGDANDAYTCDVRVYYVASLIDSDGTRRTSLEIDSLLSDKAELARSLPHTATQPTKFQFLPGVRIDYGTGHQVNQFFQRRGYSFVALEVTYRILFGVSSEV